MFYTPKEGVGHLVTASLAHNFLAFLKLQKFEEKKQKTFEKSKTKNSKLQAILNKLTKLRFSF